LNNYNPSFISKNIKLNFYLPIVSYNLVKVIDNEVASTFVASFQLHVLAIHITNRAILTNYYD